MRERAVGRRCLSKRLNEPYGFRGKIASAESGEKVEEAGEQESEKKRQEEQKQEGENQDLPSVNRH